jgi:hypothetical protein
MFHWLLFFALQGHGQAAFAKPNTILQISLEDLRIEHSVYVALTPHLYDYNSVAVVRLISAIARLAANMNAEVMAREGVKERALPMLHARAQLTPVGLKIDAFGTTREVQAFYAELFEQLIARVPYSPFWPVTNEVVDLINRKAQVREEVLEQARVEWRRGVVRALDRYEHEDAQDARRCSQELRKT